jgi:hypothetical protein
MGSYISVVNDNAFVWSCSVGPDQTALTDILFRSTRPDSSWCGGAWDATEYSSIFYGIIETAVVCRHTSREEEHVGKFGEIIHFKYLTARPLHPSHDF